MSQQIFSNFSPPILQVLLPSMVTPAQNVGMITPGERFKALRLRKGFGQSGLAAEIGLKTSQSISNFEIGKSERMYLDNWRMVAKVFGMTVEQLDDAIFGTAQDGFVADDDHILLEDDLGAKALLPADDAGKVYAAAYKASGKPLAEFMATYASALDNNVTPAPAAAPPIPEWAAEIACGQWVECSNAELDQRSQMDIIARGMFIVRCSGDSMLPTYKSGARVLFRIVRLDVEPLKIGADYYWQNCDGQCTLKRLKAIEEDGYVLAPLNRKHKPLRVAKQMISRIAIVETIMHAPWNGDD